MGLLNSAADTDRTDNRAAAGIERTPELVSAHRQHNLIRRPFDIGCLAVVRLRRRALRDIAERLDGNRDRREVLQYGLGARQEFFDDFQALFCELARRRYNYRVSPMSVENRPCYGTINNDRRLAGAAPVLLHGLAAMQNRLLHIVNEPVFNELGRPVLQYAPAIVPHEFFKIIPTRLFQSRVTRPHVEVTDLVAPCDVRGDALRNAFWTLSFLLRDPELSEGLGLAKRHQLVRLHLVPDCRLDAIPPDSLPGEHANLLNSSHLVLDRINRINRIARRAGSKLHAFPPVYVTHAVSVAAASQ